ncbi:hypothetical protein SLS60_009714 [Paraconiothyrium brasiliense]|uniref:Uncharacterized protein n=1 Tax=Paraconiothyrium brasiliense TaxID=300254 RepID=A0ABR3QSA6_9PLEO
MDANLANFVTSVLHAIAFWKELIARKRTQWQRDLNKQPCVHCGHVASKQDEAPVNDITGEEQAGSSRRPMLSNVSKVGKVVLPKWARAANIFDRRDDTKDRDVEHEAANDDVGEPFLATPEESTEDTAGPSGTYGTMSQSVESLRSIPETIVRQKDKGKKRLVDVE